MMAYIPVAQNTPWQQTDEFDMSKTAVLVIDVLGGEGGRLRVLRTWRRTA